MTVDRDMLRLLHGELDQARAARLRKRLADDPRLAARFGMLERQWAALEAPPSPLLPRDLRAQVLAAASAQHPVAPPRWMGAGVAVALVLGLALGFGIGRLGPSPGATEELILLEMDGNEAVESLSEAWLAAWSSGEESFESAQP